MRHLLSAALAVTLALPAAARAAEPGVTTFTLDNGMDAIVIEDHRAPVVVHMVWYDVGSADEPPGKSGIAHFLEHLMFKGTDELEPGEFSRVVAAQGGTDNAFTSSDYTGYFQRVAADRLGLMMEMEADRMRDLVLDSADMLTERDVVLEERAQRTDSNPGALFSEMRNAAQYLNHPYGRPIIGWKHEVEELTLEDALDFYRRYYAPNNATLIVAGDVEAEEVRRLAEAHYGPLAPTPDLAPRERPAEPPQLTPRRLTFEDARVANPYVIRTYLAPERDAGDQGDAAALAILAQYLGGSSQTSLLGRVLEQEEGTALYTSAFYSGTSLDDTTFGLVVMPRPGRSLEEAEADMDRMIARLLEQGVDDAQLERIKTAARAAEIYGRDSLQGRAREYGVAVTSGLTVEDVAAWPDALAAVTEADMLRVAREVLVPETSVTGYLKQPEPETGETEVTQ
ncbi:M16 family metallopeptidase [Jannaschia ovalis]|uniref:Pitrilysin family protein n=1 Tax=Jannaschia ovalis TaxID=3038773 RepID=A0ABY8LHI6_9RHOB|nr:pitrilysin family protein [Jannaschia sp. GRR-S6-38]WGH79815.1 pitrilysin family protein [Jannaschia sp. GRR-S6-38]